MWHEKSVRKISATIGLMPGACFVRKYLQETVRSSFPNVVVNSSTWLESRGNILFVDGAWIPRLIFNLIMNLRMWEFVLVSLFIIFANETN